MIDDYLLTTNEHRANWEELLGECIGRNISKSYRCQATAREIQRGDVTFRVGYVLHRNLQFFRQRVNPTWKSVLVSNRDGRITITTTTITTYTTYDRNEDFYREYIAISVGKSIKFLIYPSLFNYVDLR